MTISSITNAITGLFKTTEKPAQTIPAPIMAIGGLQRTGVSPSRSCANIAAELAEHGIPTGPAEDGSENKTMVYTIAIVKEIFRALQEDANIQVAFKPGDITVLCTGSGGVSNGININFPQGTAVLQ